MPTRYEEIYENLLPKFRSYEIPMMTAEEVKDYLQDYLIPAIARFHVCRQDLNDRDDILQRFNIELTVTELEILSNYVLLEYIDSTYVRTSTLLKTNLGSTDFNTYSPANMLDKLMEMRLTYRQENEGLLSRYAWQGFKNSGASLDSGYKKRNIRF